MNLLFLYLLISCFSIVSLSQQADSRVGSGIPFLNKKILKKFFSPFYYTTNINNINSLLKANFIPKDINSFYTVSQNNSPHNFFIKKNIISNKYNTISFDALTFNLKASFFSKKDSFIDLIPKKKTTLPAWARSVDFWVKSSSSDISISFFLIMPNNKLSIYSISVIKNKPNIWHKRFFNLVSKNLKAKHSSFSWNKPIVISKIRILRTDLASKKHFKISFSNPFVFNFRKSFKNQFLDPIQIIEPFNSNFNNAFVFNLNDTAKQELFIDSHPSPKATKYSQQNLLFFYNNNYFLRLDFQPFYKQYLLIAFYKKYKLLWEHNISLWVKGSKNYEQISLIFEEGKGRFFELALTDINFNGWKKIFVPIPRQNITYFKTPASKQYINIIGFKVSPHPNRKTISLAIDQINAVILHSLIRNQNS